MSLLQLPAETVIQIFDYVGSSYFRSDLSRLTVCKQWNEFARAACFQNFHVTQHTLRRLLSSQYMEPSLILVKNSVETIDLYLKGFDNWTLYPPARYDSRADEISTWDSAHGRAVRAAWTAELNQNLLYVATIIKQSRKLRILRIQATSELHRRLVPLERRDYLFLSTIRAFLSAGNLTSLELDLCGTRLEPVHQSQENGKEFHICTAIAALLITLRRLRLRMRRICADVLKPEPHKSNLRLKEILINLSLSYESPLSTSAAHASCCDSSMMGILQLKADMEKQAQVLVPQMAAPKMVRILTHILPSIEIRAYDILGNRNIKLSNGAEWGDDGEVIKEEVSDEESEISDLSSDNEG